MRDVKLLKERGMLSSPAGGQVRRPIGLVVMAVGIFGFGFVVGAATSDPGVSTPHQASLVTLDAQSKVLSKVSSTVDVDPKIAALDPEVSAIEPATETPATSEAQRSVTEVQRSAKTLDQALAGLQEELVPGHHIFTVQVSSFPTTEEASAFARQLERKGFEPYITAAEIPGRGTWHRVRVGNYTSKGDAENLRSRLAAVDVAGLVLKAR